VLRTTLACLPRAHACSTDDLRQLLLAVRGVAEDCSDDRATAGCSTSSKENGCALSRCAFLGVLLDVRSAIRARLSEMSQRELVWALVCSASLERALGAMPGLPTLGAERVGELLNARGLTQLGICGRGYGFHQLLLRETAIRATALDWLTPSDCVDLASVLADLATQSRGEAAASTCAPATPVIPCPSPATPAPPPHLARLVPPLVERVLEVLEVVRTEELVRLLELLGSGLGYRDDYFAGRIAEALRPRLARAAESASHPGGELQRRALRALAWQGPAAVEDLDSTSAGVPEQAD